MMSYEQELDYYQKYIEPELIKDDAKQYQEEKRNFQSIEANMPPEKMKNDCKIRKVVEINESA